MYRQIEYTDNQDFTECPNCGHIDQPQEFFDDEHECPRDSDHPVCPECGYCLECNEMIDEIYDNGETDDEDEDENEYAMDDDNNYKEDKNYDE